LKARKETYVNSEKDRLVETPKWESEGSFDCGHGTKRRSEKEAGRV